MKSMRFEYDTDLVRSRHRRAHGRSFSDAVAEIIAVPDQRASELTLLNDTERGQSCSGASVIRFGRAAVPSSLFEAQAERTPDAIAGGMRQ